MKNMGAKYRAEDARLIDTVNFGVYNDPDKKRDG